MKLMSGLGRCVRSLIRSKPRGIVDSVENGLTIKVLRKAYIHDIVGPCDDSETMSNEGCSKIGQEKRIRREVAEGRSGVGVKIHGACMTRGT